MVIRCRIALVQGRRGARNRPALVGMLWCTDAVVRGCSGQKCRGTEVRRTGRAGVRGAVLQ